MLGFDRFGFRSYPQSNPASDSVLLALLQIGAVRVHEFPKTFAYCSGLKTASMSRAPCSTRTTSIPSWSGT